MTIETKDESARGADDHEAAVADYSDAASTFGDRLMLAREAVGVSQNELAHRIGVKLPTLRNWEEDRSEPRANKIQLLAGMLNVSMGWLMSGHGVAPVEHTGADRERIVTACLADLRDLRADQTRIMNKIAQLEKRLRSVQN